MGALDGWRFCPRCGGALTHAGNHVQCGECGYVVWANFAVAVSVWCLDGDRVLLARRARDPGAGLWDAPGGFVEEGEHPLDAARRELAEETSLDAGALEPVGVWVDDYEERKLLALHWCGRAEGVPVPDDDVSELRWFGWDELPPRAEFAFENVWQGLLAVREQHAQRSRPDLEA